MGKVINLVGRDVLVVTLGGCKGARTIVTAAFGGKQSERVGDRAGAGRADRTTWW